MSKDTKKNYRKTDTDWTITVTPEDGILKFNVDTSGEVPCSESWSDLIKLFDEWSKKHCTKEMRIFSTPKCLIPNCGGY